MAATNTQVPSYFDMAVSRRAHKYTVVAVTPFWRVGCYDLSKDRYYLCVESLSTKVIERLQLTFPDGSHWYISRSLFLQISVRGQDNLQDRLRQCLAALLAEPLFAELDSLANVPEWVKDVIRDLHEKPEGVLVNPNATDWAKQLVSEVLNADV